MLSLAERSCACLCPCSTLVQQQSGPSEIPELSVAEAGPTLIRLQSNRASRKAYPKHCLQTGDGSLIAGGRRGVSAAWVNIWRDLDSCSMQANQPMPSLQTDTYSCSASGCALELPRCRLLSTRGRQMLSQEQWAARSARSCNENQRQMRGLTWAELLLQWAAVNNALLVL